jgi:hypothetical protein
MEIGWQPVGQVADHLEGRRPGADDDARLQHHRLDTRVDEDLADLRARGEVPG